MAERCQDADLLVAPSRFYAKIMEDRLRFPQGSIEAHPNGINLQGYRKRHENLDTPTIGFLARMCEVKGLSLLVDAFIHLRVDLGMASCRLKIAGAMTNGDVKFVESLKAKLESNGLSDAVDWQPNLSREEKIGFLQELTIFTVPVLYQEAFGLYVLEAMAASVPVLQPDTSAFPEIIEATGGGACIRIDDASSLAKGWHDILQKPETLQKLGEQGRLGVERVYSLEAMRSRFANAIESLVESPA